MVIDKVYRVALISKYLSHRQSGHGEIVAFVSFKTVSIRPEGFDLSV